MRRLRLFKLALLLTATASVAVLAVALAIPAATGPAAPSPQAAPDRAGDPAHEQPAFVRTLAVHTGTEPPASAHPERMRALLVAGTLPREVVEATVLSDEDCQPDARGVSHCRNELRLPDGRKLTVRHPHRMSEVPCLVPGEVVRLGRAA